MKNSLIICFLALAMTTACGEIDATHSPESPQLHTQLSLSMSVLLDGETREVVVNHPRSITRAQAINVTHQLVEAGAGLPAWAQARVDLHDWLSEMEAMAPEATDLAVNTCVRSGGLDDIICGRLTPVSTGDEDGGEAEDNDVEADDTRPHVEERPLPETEE